MFLFVLSFTGEYLLKDFRYQNHFMNAMGYFPNQANVPAKEFDYVNATKKAYLNNGKIIYTDGRYFSFRNFSDIY
jgi:hypothetical protein